MAEALSGLFSVREFNYRRNVLKIAPDAFITINDATTSAVVSPMEPSGVKTTDMRGGVTSINVSSAVTPAGASRATIEVIAPQYKGLHEDYYITLPNGTRTPVFTPMMEVKIYMKGRFLEEEFKWAPKYYPVFWGMITGVQENYNSGAYTFSITCEDLLCWWKHQKITMQSGVINTFFGGGTMQRFPSTFQNMSPWEILLALFTDTFFMQEDESQGIQRRLDFLYPQLSNIAQQPDIEYLRETWGPFANKAVDYWKKRFGFGVLSENDTVDGRAATSEDIAASMNNIPLEMYGMRGPISWDTISKRLMSFLDKTNFQVGTQTDRKANIDLDFHMLARVQPYGLFDNYGDGSEPNILSKLDIINAVCEKVNMEFFVDTNGSFVFKPPLYNLDVRSGDLAYYRVGPEEIVNFNTNFDSNSVLNYLVVTGPVWPQTKMEAIGLHADFESIKNYGIRSDQITVSYGMNAEQLKMIAVAEMTRRNGQAYTGSLSMPLRPEMRLGYPVYLPHIDTFYYVTGISHSYTYGSAATTDLSLQYRRERMFADGFTKLAGTYAGDVLDACVMRERTSDIEKISADNIAEKNINIAAVKFARDHVGLDPKADGYKTKLTAIINEQKRLNLGKMNRTYSGPDILGYWEVSKAVMKPYSDTMKNPDGPNATISDELVMITDKTVPYTDRNGYRHIGAFPFGANLVLMKTGEVYNISNESHKKAMETNIQQNASGLLTSVVAPQSNEVGQDVAGRPNSEGTPPSMLPKFATAAEALAWVRQGRDWAPPDKTATDAEIRQVLAIVPQSISPASTPRGDTRGVSPQQLTS